MALASLIITVLSLLRLNLESMKRQQLQSQLRFLYVLLDI